jgi:hypothetical protein
MIVRPSELSNFCPSPGARKNGMAEGFVRDVQVVHVVIEFIETGSDGDHSLSARTKIRSAAAAGHLGHPGPLLVLSTLTMPPSDASTAASRTSAWKHQLACHRAALHHHTTSSSRWHIAPRRFDGQMGLKVDQHENPHTVK